jgi:hypothetical protein
MLQKHHVQRWLRDLILQHPVVDLNDREGALIVGVTMEDYDAVVIRFLNGRQYTITIGEG